MDQFIKVMKALSDPNRLEIFKMLRHKTMGVREIQKAKGRDAIGFVGN
jgi:ArsR family transcriptional regulator, arsenate/arsenite/antimonite-responsive transcriptional repressor